MSDISLRISRLIDEKKLNKRSLSVLVGYSDVAIGKIINGKSKPKFELLETLVSVFPDVNPTWLLTGEGEMLLHSASNSNVNINTNVGRDNFEGIKGNVKNVRNSNKQQADNDKIELLNEKIEMLKDNLEIQKDLNKSLKQALKDCRENK